MMNLKKLWLYLEINYSTGNYNIQITKEKNNN